MPAVTMTAAVGAKRCCSAGSGLGTGSRLAGAGSEASAVKKQGSAMARARQGRCNEAQGGRSWNGKRSGLGLAEKQEAGRENMK